MSRVDLSALPDDARAWCFGSGAPPPVESVARLRAAMADFLEGWTAHRADLRAGFDWMYDRFLVVAVDESAVGASGCSIDAMTDEVRRLEGETGVTLLDASPIWYRDEAGDVRCVARDEFRALAAAGEIGPATRVFDLTVERLGAVRSGAWEADAGRSWHARLL